MPDDNLGNETAKQPTKWQDTIPAELKESLFVKDRFVKDETPANLAKSYVELEKGFHGRVKIPDEKTTEQERNEFYNKLGRPETPDKYELKRPEKLPEGMGYDENFEKSMKMLAYNAGLSQSQLSVLADGFNKYQSELFTGEIQRIKQLNDGRWLNYKKEWGETKTTENVEYAKRCFDEFAPKELKELMTRDDVESDPILVAMYSSIWRKTLNDTLVQGQQVKDETHIPRFPNSPEMYRNAPGEEGEKARAYFTEKGYKYE